MTQQRQRRSAEERLWARMAPGRPDECWVWPGFKNAAGYGKISLFGRDESGTYWRSSAYTHRVAYESLVGPIPTGLVIDHLCRNKSCCNPAHLEPVTQRENTYRAPESLAVVNSRKDECPAGHPYNADNTYVGKQGTRFCRTCNREQKAARRYLPPSERGPARGGRPLGGRWSGRSDACLECRTTSVQHRARGLCVNCYARKRRMERRAEQQ